MSKNRKLGTSKRIFVLLRDDFKCYLCGKQLPRRIKCPLGQITIDHLLPRTKGGSSDTQNLRTCCPKCNVQKGAKIYNMNNKIAFNWTKHKNGDLSFELEMLKLRIKCTNNNKNPYYLYLNEMFIGNYKSITSAKKSAQAHLETAATAMLERIKKLEYHDDITDVGEETIVYHI